MKKTMKIAALVLTASVLLGTTAALAAENDTDEQTAATTYTLENPESKPSHRILARSHRATRGRNVDSCPLL